MHSPNQIDGCRSSTRLETPAFVRVCVAIVISTTINKHDNDDDNNQELLALIIRKQQLIS